MANAPKNFAETVRGVRHQLGISQEELAYELSVSFSTINRWENYLRNFRSSMSSAMLKKGLVEGSPAF